MRRSVCLGETAIDLTPRELALLEYLAMRQNTVLSRSEIEEHIYDEQVSPMSNVVDTAVCALRQAIANPDDSTPLIRVHGRKVT